MLFIQRIMRTVLETLPLEKKMQSFSLLKHVIYIVTTII
jgi:hypothetical protein